MHFLSLLLKREDDNAHPSQAKRPNAPKNCSTKFQTPAYNLVTNSWSDLRVMITIKDTFFWWNSSPRDGEEIYHLKLSPTLLVIASPAS
jgi:hypothetical protein